MGCIVEIPALTRDEQIIVQPCPRSGPAPAGGLLSKATFLYGLQ